MDENERSEEELETEAHELVQQFFAMMQVEPVTENGLMNFRVMVPVIKDFMDLSKLGLPADAPVPHAVGMLMQTEMPVAVWEAQSQPMIREAIKQQVGRQLVESGVIVDS